MKTFRVLTPYCLRDEHGRLTGTQAEVGSVIPLADAEGRRLARAGCVVFVEEQIVRASEDRMIRRQRREAKSS